MIRVMDSSDKSDFRWLIFFVVALLIFAAILYKCNVDFWWRESIVIVYWFVPSAAVYCCGGDFYSVLRSDGPLDVEAGYVVYNVVN